MSEQLLRPIIDWYHDESSGDTRTTAQRLRIPFIAIPALITPSGIDMELQTVYTAEKRQTSRCVK